MSSTTSTDEKKAPATAGQHPWQDLLNAHSNFITHLDCITETFGTILPILESKDKERRDRINELTSILKKGADSGTEFPALSSLTELLAHLRKLRQSEKMFRENTITSIISRFDEFVINLLKAAYKANPSWLKNPEKKLSYKELLELESLEQLKSEIIAKEIDGLMRDSHYTQVTFLDGRLKLGIQDGFPGWKNFLEITERRNLAVHTGGIVSSVYLENCKKWQIAIAPDLKEGDSISVTNEYISASVDCLYELSLRLCQAGVRRLFPDSLKSADSTINIQGVALLDSEQWELAARVFEFALGIPQDLRSRDEMEYYFHINLCIALKFGGKDFQKRLHSVNWKPLHPKYHFAVAVLEDRFDDAAKLMSTEAVREEVSEGALKEWPLLRSFRNTEQFQRSFKDIFGKEYAQQLIEDVKKEVTAADTGTNESSSVLTRVSKRLSSPQGKVTQIRSTNTEKRKKNARHYARSSKPQS